MLTNMTPTISSISLPLSSLLVLVARRFPIYVFHCTNWSEGLARQGVPTDDTAIKKTTAGMCCKKKQLRVLSTRFCSASRVSKQATARPSIGVAFGIFWNGGVLRVNVATLKGVAFGISHTITKRLDLTSGSSLGFRLRPQNRRDPNPVAIAKMGPKKKRACRSDWPEEGRVGLGTSRCLLSSL